jgi:hypothetical protein
MATPSTPLVPHLFTEAIPAALEMLSPEQYAAATSAFDSAHADALSILGGAQPSALPRVSREAVLAKAAIDPVAAAELAAALDGLSLPYVDPDGNMWGFGFLQQLDPGWLLAVLAWLYYPNFDKPPFPKPPLKVVAAPDTMDVAILGDWGGGPRSAAAVVLDQVKLLSPYPVYTIHLGDVYYFGAPSNGVLGFMGGHAELNKFVEPWVTGTSGSFTLNSNHEMYAAAQGLIQVALTSPKFALQQGVTYFALENDAFVIVGLDSAFYADWGNLYMDGNLSPDQIDFLAAQAQKKTTSGAPKKLVILTHHTGLNAIGVPWNTVSPSADEARASALWQQVTGALPAGTTAYWYWGHYHQAAVYAPVTLANGTTIYPRCAGHGCFPFGPAPALAAATGDTVVWYESTSVDPGGPNAIYMLNGFANLSFNGPNLTETFIDQNGGKYVVPPAG